MKIWTEYIWKSFISGYGHSVLLLDFFPCHKQPSFLDLVKTFGKDAELVPGGCTCVLQLCDVATLKSLKKELRKYYMDLASSIYCSLNSSRRLPVLDKVDYFLDI